jgi:hypothetical protein
MAWPLWTGDVDMASNGGAAEDFRFQTCDESAARAIVVTARVRINTTVHGPVIRSGGRWPPALRARTAGRLSAGTRNLRSRPGLDS